MNHLTIRGEKALSAPIATPKYSTPQGTNSSTAKLQQKQSNTVMDPREMTRALFGPAASGMQSLLKNNMESGEGSRIASVTPLFGNGKDNTRVN